MADTTKEKEPPKDPVKGEEKASSKGDKAPAKTLKKGEKKVSSKGDKAPAKTLKKGEKKVSSKGDKKAPAKTLKKGEKPLSTKDLKGKKLPPKELAKRKGKVPPKEWAKRKGKVPPKELAKRKGKVPPKGLAKKKGKVPLKGTKGVKKSLSKSTDKKQKQVAPKPKRLRKDTDLPKRRLPRNVPKVKLNLKPKVKKVGKKTTDNDKVLKSGVVKFNYHRAKRIALTKLLGKKYAQRRKAPEEETVGKPKKAKYYKKKMKDGSIKKMPIPKRPHNYEETGPKKRAPIVSKVRTKLRSSLKKGTVCIILTGLHKGKRVVFLKQLPSGSCLVTGPYLLNGCPLRSIHQGYLIATSVRLRLNKLNVPAVLTDEYFKRKRLNKTKDKDNIFDEKEKKIKIPTERYATQSVVDKPVLRAILRHPESRTLKTYLHTKFLLQSKDYPHKMKF